MSGPRRKGRVEGGVDRHSVVEQLCLHKAVRALDALEGVVPLVIRNHILVQRAVENLAAPFQAGVVLALVQRLVVLDAVGRSQAHSAQERKAATHHEDGTIG
eukprot:5338615-Pyramimonas_sp.AAC.1